MTDYLSLVQALFQAPKMGAKLSLDGVRKLDAALGNPSKAFASVHVGGTNGKGSVCTKVAEALRYEGKSVGLFTSPHIATFRERIRINGGLLAEEDIQMLLPQVLEAADCVCISPSFFELITALAFLAFATKGVEVAVVEVGLGGRLDATNIINPLVSVITSIDLDHTAILGDSLESIAYEKGGIIKPKVPVVLGPTAQYDLLCKKAEIGESPLIKVRGPFADCEEECKAIAKSTLEVLGIEELATQKGIERRPPCRFEIVEKNLPVILDVAHNRAALEALLTRLDLYFPKQRFRAVLGFSSDKPVQDLIELVEKKCTHVAMTHTDHPRVAPMGNPNIEQVLQEVLEKAQAAGEGVVVCGTFYIMDKVRAFLGIDEPRDPLCLTDSISLK